MVYTVDVLGLLCVSFFSILVEILTSFSDELVSIFYGNLLKLSRTIYQTIFIPKLVDGHYIFQIFVPTIWTSYNPRATYYSIF